MRAAVLGACCILAPVCKQSLHCGGAAHQSTRSSPSGAVSREVTGPQAHYGRAVRPLQREMCARSPRGARHPIVAPGGRTAGDQSANPGDDEVGWMGAKYPWLVAKSCKDLVLSSRVNGTITTPERAAGPRDAEAFRLHAELCKVFTDPKRLLVLEALRAGECSVGELAEGGGMSLPNAIQHLSGLGPAGLAGTRFNGRAAPPRGDHRLLLIVRAADRPSVRHRSPDRAGPHAGGSPPPPELGCRGGDRGRYRNVFVNWVSVRRPHRVII